MYSHEKNQPAVKMAAGWFQRSSPGAAEDA
jgi:hypothetical protein